MTLEAGHSICGIFDIFDSPFLFWLETLLILSNREIGTSNNCGRCRPRNSPQQNVCTFKITGTELFKNSSTSSMRSGCPSANAYNSSRNLMTSWAYAFLNSSPLFQDPSLQPGMRREQTQAQYHSCKNEITHASTSSFLALVFRVTFFLPRATVSTMRAKASCGVIFFRRRR